MPLPPKGPRLAYPAPPPDHLPSPLSVASSIHDITHPFLHIRNTEDALVVLEAVRAGALPLISVRRGSKERATLQSGNVFVWEENRAATGLVRWMDGRRWLRMKTTRDCVLYQEMLADPETDKLEKTTRKFQPILNPGSEIMTQRQYPSKSGGLTKQAFSFHFADPVTHTSRRWHLVAYSLRDELDRLPVIESLPQLRNITVPAGVFTASGAAESHLSQHAARPPSLAEARAEWLPNIGSLRPIQLPPIIDPVAGDTEVAGGTKIALEPPVMDTVIQVGKDIVQRLGIRL